MEHKVAAFGSECRSYAGGYISPPISAQNEINAYFAAGKVDLPEVLQAVKFRGQPEPITGTAQSYFDVDEEATVP